MWCNIPQKWKHKQETKWSSFTRETREQQIIVPELIHACIYKLDNRNLILCKNILTYASISRFRSVFLLEKVLPKRCTSNLRHSVLPKRKVLRRIRLPPSHRLCSIHTAHKRHHRHRHPWPSQHRRLYCRATSCCTEGNPMPLVQWNGCKLTGTPVRRTPT